MILVISHSSFGIGEYDLQSMHDLQGNWNSRGEEAFMKHLPCSKPVFGSSSCRAMEPPEVLKNPHAQSIPWTDLKFWGAQPS